MAAGSAAIQAAGPVLPRPAMIRGNLDHLRCDLSQLAMSFLDSSELMLVNRHDTHWPGFSPRGL